MIDLLSKRHARSIDAGARQRAMIDYLKAMVICNPLSIERIHAVFFDRDRSFLGDAPLGQGGVGSLTLRMREVFGKALAMDAHGFIIAHNHPSGNCRPSQHDIDATARLNSIARSLDIELFDHLIFTQHAVYSMRAGGQL